MTRGAVAVALFLAALPLLAAVTWYDNYRNGLEDVRSGKYASGAEALQRAIAEMPSENGSARFRNEIITYVPHFWLGIAKFNLGDFDGALRELRISEQQGVVQNTPYFAQLRDWVAKANSAKQRNAQAVAGESKKEANAAVTRAAAAQMMAVGAGGDRTDAYRAAQRKLNEALDTSSKGGTDISAYKRAADLAAQARELFVAAAEEGKRLRAARPPQVAVVKPQVQVPKPQPPPIQPPPPQPQPMAAPAPRAVAAITPTENPDEGKIEPPVDTSARANARIAVQTYKRHLMDLHQPILDAQKLERALSRADEKGFVRITAQVAEKERFLAEKEKATKARNDVESVEARGPEIHAQLEAAFRLYAAGDLAGSERRLSDLIATQRAAEAYLLRGCTRYTAAMLGRNRDAVLATAAADFHEALKLNAALRLDKRAFSPKLVTYFDGLRGSR
jgi:hypothetical protein